MRFRIFSDGMDIGGSNLERLDPSMGVAMGVFFPSENYKRVQPVFRLYAEAGTNIVDQDTDQLNRYYAARDALSLVLMTETGEAVPTDCIHITDYSVELGEYEIAIIAADSDAFERYFEVPK